MKAHTISTLIPEQELKERIAQIAGQISSDYAGGKVKLLCVLKGGVFFACELAKLITVPVTIDFMQISSYGSGTMSSKKAVIRKEPDDVLEGQNVIVVEDIVDTGYTLAALKEYLESKKPESVKTCVLLDKPDRREADVCADYRGFEIPNVFVVGFGLDYDGQYRNLPYVGALDFDGITA